MGRTLLSYYSGRIGKSHDEHTSRGALATGHPAHRTLNHFFNSTVPMNLSLLDKSELVIPSFLHFPSFVRTVRWPRMLRTYLLCRSSSFLSKIHGRPGGFNLIEPRLQCLPSFRILREIAERYKMGRQRGPALESSGLRTGERVVSPQARWCRESTEKPLDGNLLVPGVVLTIRCPTQMQILVLFLDKIGLCLTAHWTLTAVLSCNIRHSYSKLCFSTRFNCLPLSADLDNCHCAFRYFPGERKEASPLGNLLKG